MEDLAEAAEIAILDLGRVTEIDATGGQSLIRLGRFLARHGTRLLISRAEPFTSTGSLLRDMVRAQQNQDMLFFEDIDSALAWSEDAVLADQADTAPAELTIDTLDMLAGLTADQRDRLERYLRRLTFQAGDRIIEEDGACDAMYFLSSGAVSARRLIPGTLRRVRLAGIGPGLTFGEMALLGINRRTADIYADSEIVCYRLGRDDFEQICTEHPDVGIQLLMNLAKVTALRLELTSEEVRTLSQ